MSRRTGTFQGQLFHRRRASAGRYGPRVRRVPATRRALLPIEDLGVWVGGGRAESATVGRLLGVTQDVARTDLAPVARARLPPCHATRAGRIPDPAPAKMATGSK